MVDATPSEGIAGERVQAWFSKNVPEARPPLGFRMIAGGRSNLTYAVTDARGHLWVLRRPPLGKRLGSAHDMNREYRVISALAPTPVPVPRITAFCTNDDVTGAPFYVMEFVAGPILRSVEDAAPFSEASRAAISERVVETLADIHGVDTDAVGLGDLGRKNDFVARTLHRWRVQWDRSKTRDIPLVAEVHDRLAARVPRQGPATIVHGDYRLDNVILNAEGRVAAVLDWELSTLGDPLADLGLLLVYWGDEGDVLLPLVETATRLPGFARRDDIIRLYANYSGRDVSGISYYVALGYWKLAIVLEGVSARVAAGQHGRNAGNDGRAADFRETVERLITAADEAERR